MGSADGYMMRVYDAYIRRWLFQVMTTQLVVAVDAKTRRSYAMFIYKYNTWQNQRPNGVFVAAAYQYAADTSRLWHNSGTAGAFQLPEYSSTTGA